VFPFAHIAAGQTAIIIGKITKQNLFEAVHNYKPGMVFGFPTFLLLLVNDPEAAQYDFSSLEVGLTGGAPVTPATEQALMKLPNLRCLINVSEIDVEIKLIFIEFNCSRVMV
jgi:acyl-coenzyme A synthetase/AMP-(fatty) acid ligase